MYKEQQCYCVHISLQNNRIQIHIDNDLQQNHVMVLEDKASILCLCQDDRMRSICSLIVYDVQDLHPSFVLECGHLRLDISTNQFQY